MTNLVVSVGKPRNMLRCAARRGAAESAGGISMDPRETTSNPRDRPGLRIRRYEPSDRDAVLSLHRLALDGAGANVGGDYFADLDDIETCYLQAGGEFLVGILDGELIAMGAYSPLGGETVEIKRMRVHPSRQRRGCGKCMLLDLERRARRRGIQRVILETTSVQLAAGSLYRNQGYREVSRGSKLGFETVSYEKRLA